MFALLVSFVFAQTATEWSEVYIPRRVSHSTWYLGMNLNPSDGHVMDYITGWADDAFVGTYSKALKEDYLNPLVWKHPVTYIAIVRHQQGEVDAVKVFRFKEGGRSLWSMFQAMNPGSDVVTEGGPIQESVSINAKNMVDDPVFSVGGDLGFNWQYSSNRGARIVLTGVSHTDGNNPPMGLGNSFGVNPLTGVGRQNAEYYRKWSHEISIYAEKVQGTDHGSGATYESVAAYGNYAIYVSEDATSFPEPGFKLDIEVEVMGKYKFFSDE